MIMMVSATENKTHEIVNGYFETGDCFSPMGGFIKYLQDNGYSEIKVYSRNGGLVVDDDVNRWKRIIIQEKLKNFQLEYSNAIKSIDYYPDTPENNMMRIRYSKTRLTYQHFEVPDKRAKTVY